MTRPCVPSPTFTQIVALAASLAPAGRLTKRARHLLAALIHPSGALTRSAHKLLRATSTPVGRLRRSATRTLSGAISPAAALLRAPHVLLGAALSLAATIATQIHRFGPVVREALRAVARAAQFLTLERTTGLMGAVRRASRLQRSVGDVAAPRPPEAAPAAGCG
jgi:hypothetical protein